MENPSIIAVDSPTETHCITKVWSSSIVDFVDHSRDLESVGRGGGRDGRMQLRRETRLLTRFMPVRRNKERTGER